MKNKTAFFKCLKKNCILFKKINSNGGGDSLELFKNYNYLIFI